MTDRAGSSLAADRTGAYAEALPTGYGFPSIGMVCKRSAVYRLLGIDVNTTTIRILISRLCVTPSFAVIGRNPLFAIDAFIVGQVQGAQLPTVFWLARIE
jgi:hypothetical protein